MYDSWEKSALFFESSGETFESFAQKNESFILYFWATWCPHCKNIFQQMQTLKNANIQTVALPFDSDWDSYHLYREKKRSVLAGFGSTFKRRRGGFCAAQRRIRHSADTVRLDYKKRQSSKNLCWRRRREKTFSVS